MLSDNLISPVTTITSLLPGRRRSWSEGRGLPDMEVRDLRAVSDAQVSKLMEEMSKCGETGRADEGRHGPQRRRESTKPPAPWRPGTSAPWCSLVRSPTLLGVHGLGRLPRLSKLRTHRRVELVLQRALEVGRADELEHVGEILQPVGRAEPGGELQLDQSRQRQERAVAAADRDLGGIRGGHGDRKSTRLNSSHPSKSRMPSSA